MRQADLSRQKNQNLSELEAEARDRAQYLLERANALRMEQEDEVKKLNEVDRTAIKSNHSCVSRLHSHFEVSSRRCICWPQTLRLSHLSHV